MNQMIIFVIEPNGKFYQELRGTPQEVLAQIPEGYNSTSIMPPRNTDYWNGTSWVDIGPAPQWYFQFDYNTKKWVDSRDLEQTKKEKWERIKLERNTLELSGFVYNGNVYDSDMTSQIRIICGAVLGAPTTWTLQNNEVIELTSEQLKELGQALAQHVQGLHDRARAARININACTTADQVDAVNF